MESENDLVQMTKRRLTRLNGVRKLEKNAILKIIKSINHNATLDPRNHLATYLPYGMCDKIFRHLLLEMKVNPEINKAEYRLKIPFLLTANTRYLNLDAFLPQRTAKNTDQVPYIENDELIVIKWVIDKVKQQAPNIEHIVLNSRKISFLKDEQQQKLLDYLTELKHLKIVEMKYLYLGFSQLTKLCRPRIMPKMQILDIFGFEKPCGSKVRLKEIIKSLKNLRLLVRNSNEKRAIQHQCPHLYLASRFESYIETAFRPYTFKDFLVSKTGKGSRRQRKYFLCDDDWFNSPVMDIHLKHPDVTYLEIQCQFVTLQMPKFSKISTLIVWKAENETVITDILRLYGKELRTLCLQSWGPQSFDRNISELCPKLETIQLIREGGFGGTIQLGQVPHLTKLSIDSSFRCISRNLLPKILSSPHLQKIEISGQFYKEDLVELNKMVTKNQILQELESLQICTYESDPDTFEELVHFLENVSAFLPKLRDVQFFPGDEEYVDYVNFLKNNQDRYHDEVLDIIVNNETLVPILESFRKLRT